MNGVIETSGLSRRFGKHLAVDELNITVPSGAIYGFLGRNGAGKTTTLRMLLGLLRPSSGSIRVCGIDVQKDRIAAARKLGAMLESHGFYRNLSGFENLRMAAYLLGHGPEEVGRVLDLVGMSPQSGKRVSDYSLGMRQRLALARALIGAPSVLVLDEPTNGLDPEGIVEMRMLVRELPARAGTTVLLSSHLLNEIEQTATHIGILKEGRLVVEGALLELKGGQAPEISVRTNNDVLAAEAIKARGLRTFPSESGVSVRLGDGDGADETAAVIARAVFDAGLSIFALSRRDHSLEDIYHSAGNASDVRRVA
jgi:lantibiotic transport system ATP-binding protein